VEAAVAVEVMDAALGPILSVYTGHDTECGPGVMAMDLLIVPHTGEVQRGP
jgi:hypothetical protein